MWDNAFGKWKKFLNLMLLLPFPSRSLKYFPPEFTLRNPLYSMVDANRRKGNDCAVLLFYLGSHHSISSLYPQAFSEDLLQQMKDKFVEILTKYFSEKEVLGVKQFGVEDITVFIKVEDGASYDWLHQKELQMRKDLDAAFNHLFALKFEPSFKIQSGSLFMGPETNTELSIQIAYHYALSIATRKLPPHFAPYRQEMEKIIHEEAIYVLTQPIMDLKTGEIMGWEILTRGPSNSRFHLPTELFDFAHKADLLIQLEFLVIRKAFHEIASRNITEQVFINITPITLLLPSLLDHLLDCIKMYPQISPSQIVLEITERHSIRDYDQMGAILQKFRAHGFRFAVDDAGAGYSSLQSISELIPDIIKIDKSVIQNIDRVSVKQSLLKALLLFADDIQCQVIAEGVEREEEASVLFSHDVQLGQGFYFARPVQKQLDYEPKHFTILKEKIIRLRQAI